MATWQDRVWKVRTAFASLFPANEGSLDGPDTDAIDFASATSEEILRNERRRNLEWDSLIQHSLLGPVRTLLCIAPAEHEAWARRPKQCTVRPLRPPIVFECLRAEPLWEHVWEWAATDPSSSDRRPLRCVLQLEGRAECFRPLFDQLVLGNSLLRFLPPRQAPEVTTGLLGLDRQDEPAARFLTALHMLSWRSRDENGDAQQPRLFVQGATRVLAIDRVPPTRDAVWNAVRAHRMLRIDPLSGCATEFGPPTWARAADSFPPLLPDTPWCVSSIPAFALPYMAIEAMDKVLEETREPAPSDLVTQSAAAREFHCHRQTIARMIKSGSIRSYTALRKVSLAEVEAILDKKPSPDR